MHRKHFQLLQTGWRKALHSILDADNVVCLYVILHFTHIKYHFHRDSTLFLLFFFILVSLHFIVSVFIHTFFLSLYFSQFFLSKYIWNLCAVCKEKCFFLCAFLKDWQSVLISTFIGICNISAELLDVFFHVRSLHSGQQPVFSPT